MALRVNDISELHPLMREPVRLLSQELERAFRDGRTLSYFQLFETYRSPEAQDALYKGGKGTTKARGWQSAHQFGLAADFVPWTKDGWSWEPHHDWNFLRAQAMRLGLQNHIQWDRPHIQHPDFELLKLRIRR